ncbi:PH domain-containing protein [Chryseobacterium sp. cx-311]|uniref:PH domain-containing protein n=1 Tax=Marnyiella aurantia TaxID=2758037 RepID=UPI001AE2438F|nr:PH domain-containing protein [Marnyiella aurantia]MBP0611496.1 PH domain-containing protein [Marnyiella aurantia]
MKKFRTKYGLELPIFIIIMFGFIIWDVAEWGIVLALAAVSLLIAFILSGIRYSVSPENLIVHTSHFTRTEIPISAIRKIRETNNPLSSPAGSMDRIEIFYNKFDSIIISPVRTEEFLKNLLAINPKIEVIRKPKRNIFSKLAL